MWQPYMLSRGEPHNMNADQLEKLVTKRCGLRADPKIVGQITDIPVPPYHDFLLVAT